MPDISMCNNQSCLVKETCYRFMAKPSDYQCYSTFEPKDGVGCVHFMKLYDKNTHFNRDEQLSSNILLESLRRKIDIQWG